jgi:L-ascorbate metabolism protein UlaG (beta-lactamase superfamily)
MYTTRGGGGRKNTTRWQKVKLQWIGGPTFLLELGSFRVLADPVLGTGEAAFHLRAPREKAAREESDRGAGVPVTRLTELPAVNIEALDLVLVSRMRADHLDPTAVDRLDSSLAVILPAGQASVLEADGFHNTHQLQWWGEAFETKGDETLTVVAVPVALPGVSVPPDARKPGGDANGYIIEHAVRDKKYTIYWTGDTLWFPQSRDIKERCGDVDLMIVHLGAVGADADDRTTLNGKEAMQFVYMFQPKRLLAINHSTFSHYTESIDDFSQRIDLTLYDRRLVLLTEGETFEPK